MNVAIAANKTMSDDQPTLALATGLKKNGREINFCAPLGTNWKTTNKIILIVFLFLFTLSIFGQTSKPFVLGITDEIQSTQLAEKRELNIYLPEGYSPKDTIKYPVIYLLDGSADEDFIHIVGLVQFNSFEWIKLVPKSIVVGIATVDRKRDFTFPTTIDEDKKAYPTTGHSDKFIAFLETELQPFIEKYYKTNNSKTIIGQSLGGLLAAEILMKKPTLFDKYIIISPSLWWDNGSLLNQNPESRKTPLNRKHVFILELERKGRPQPRFPE